MPQSAVLKSWFSKNQIMNPQSKSQIEQEYKLPLRQWLINKIEQKAFVGVEWIDEEKAIFKIPWTQKHHPKWNEHFEIFRAWAKHKDKYDEANPPDEKKLKGNFRCALHKSVDFEEMPDSSAMAQQTGNYKIYRVLKREEVREKNRLKKKSSSQHHHDTKPPKIKDVKQQAGPAPHEVTTSYPIQGAMQQQSFPQGQFHMDQSNPGPQTPIYQNLSTVQPITMNLNSSILDDVQFQRTLNDLRASANTSNGCDNDFDLAIGVEDEDLSIGNLSKSNLMFSSTTAPAASKYDDSPMSIGSEPAFDHPQARMSIKDLVATFDIDWNNMFFFDVSFKYDGHVMAYEQLNCFAGRRVFYGDEPMQRAIMEAFQHSVPPEVFKYEPYVMPKYHGNAPTVSEILTRTDQGFTLKCDDQANLWVTRLSQSVLFYYDLQKSNEPIKLDRYKPVQLISCLELAKDVLRRRNDGHNRPSCEFRLYVGCKPRSPGQQCPVMVNITAAAALKIVESVFGSEQNSMLAFSQQNSLDNLLRML
uniref:Interferon regulatory factor like protein n=1 Tax=Phallusia mammillata TaxID=59560 RepID=A0A6F9DEN2_9ASCI|nr:interferon regulatory factor like protein [Phallusia mammillata]